MPRTADEIQADLDRISRVMPAMYSHVIINIDHHIWGAQQGFDLATELYMVRAIEASEADKVFKRAYALNMLVAEDAKVAATARKEWVMPRCIEAEVGKIDTDVALFNARYERERWLEKLNTLKKIKGDSVMHRGAG